MASNPPKFTELNDLTCEEIGGKILFATDDWFASAECLLKSEPPVWKEGFTDFGKWMDGWETRRKRKPGHDWCLIKLGVRGQIVGFEVDTAFFTGNYSPKFSIQGFTGLDLEKKLSPRDPSMGKEASEKELEEVAALKTDEWETLIPITPLGSGYPETRNNFFQIKIDSVFTYLRLNMFPDGGIARLRTHGIVATPDPSNLVSYKISELGPDAESVAGALKADEPLVDLLAMENGSVCLGYSDAHYGHPRNMARPGRGKNMGDGWETARRLDRPEILRSLPENPNILEFVGSEWAIFKLGVAGTVQLIEIDTNHFKGNFPDSVAIDGAVIRSSENEEEGKTKFDDPEIWTSILPAQKLGPHKRHFYCSEILCQNQNIFTHVKIIMKPDGGISRVRLLGQI